MKPSKKADEKLLKRAADSNCLESRATGNQQFGTQDFNAWSRQLLEKKSGRNILDVCCGTGNQLKIYSSLPIAEHIVGADISKDALEKAAAFFPQDIASGRLTLKNTAMENLFKEPPLSTDHFHLISCFYGLYYAKDPMAVLEGMLRHLSPGGSIIVVGPYGPNNSTLFDILAKHMTLPEFVMRSSSTFMTEEVVPFLTERSQVTKDVFVNPVQYPTVEAVMKYWQTTTFYDKAQHAAVQKDLEAHFAHHNGFIVEKHVMACCGRIPA